MRKQEMVLIMIIFIIASLFVFIYYKLGGEGDLYRRTKEKDGCGVYGKKYGQEFEFVDLWEENLMMFQMFCLCTG